MRNLNRILFFTGLSLVFMMLGLRLQAYDFITDDSGIYVITWNPGTVSMNLKMPAPASPLTDGSNYNTSVQAAMQAWNSLLETLQLSSQIQPAGPATNGDRINEITMESTVGGQAFGTNTLAVTLSYSNGDSRTESDIVFNTAYTWDSYRGPRNGRTALDIQRIAIHELGHVLGLNHPDTASPPQSVNAIMNSRVSNIDTMQADDINGAQLLYGAPGFVPANNNFSNAIPITLSGSSAQLTGSNVAATRQAGEPNHAGANAPGHSVWWKWTAPGSASVTIDTLGSNFDTVLAVYTGTSVSALTAIAANDDAELPVAGGNNPQRKRTSTVTFNAIGGTTYSIAVDGWGSIADGDAGTYTGAIRLNLTSASTAAVAPVITIQPQSQTVALGASVSFTAAAGGSPAPTFQWKKGGLNIVGATSSVYTLVNVQATNAGSYTVLATNSSGSATSNVAALTVMASPVITTQPVSQVVATGRPVTFTAAASGTPAPTYQWQKNGVNISGATGSSYTIASVVVGDAGTYRIIAVNAAGSVASNGATFTVLANSSGDFNADGKPDLLWSNSLTGERAVWLMNGTNFLASSTLGIFPLEWTIAATGDFNSDGKSDIVWSNSLTGERAIWLMNGTNFLASSTLGIFPLEWTVAATGDFNNDGKPDLLWSNSLTGERAIWLMNGTSLLLSSTLGVFPLEWTVAATGDFNSDGKPDIIWSNSITGERAIWLMNGTNFLASSTLGIFPLEWTVVGTADFNGDGKTDIIWANSLTGERAIWLMNGTNFLASSTLGIFPLEWTVKN